MIIYTMTGRNSHTLMRNLQVAATSMYDNMNVDAFKTKFSSL